MSEKNVIKHVHQFMKTSELNTRGVAGVAVVCAICGEVRFVYQNGEITIIHEAWEKIA